jgi:hypothetical protein
MSIYKLSNPECIVVIGGGGNDWGADNKAGKGG